MKYNPIFSDLKAQINQKLKTRSSLYVGYTYTRDKGCSLYHARSDGGIIKTTPYRSPREMKIAMESYLQAIELV